MPFDEGLAERVRDIFEDVHEVIYEKKMFGGLCFMVNGHMCIGIDNERLMLRVGPDQYEDTLKKPYASVMDFTKKPLKGFVYVDQEGFDSDEELKEWIDIALRFVTTLDPK